MGCGSSVAKELPLSPAQVVEGGQADGDPKPQPESEPGYSNRAGGFRHTKSASQSNRAAQAEAQPVARSSSSEAFRQVLSTRKWVILMDWCGWHEKDQFGFEQPSVRDILGPAGRSKLGAHERPHEYQVAVSFPGAEFVKGEHGHCSNLTDAQGRLIATNGAEMAEAVRGWLAEDWLGGEARRGLTHVFIDKINLQYCAGSVRAVNFGRNPEAYAVLNENWAIYLREAFLECRVVVFLLNQDWLDSIPCNQEFEGLIRRKSTYATDGAKRAVVFVDITDPGYKGRLLPEYFASMRQQAALHFDVHNLVYNETLSSEDKSAVRKSLDSIVRQYGTAYEVPALEIEDMARTTVQWRNWLYFRCLEGTNGWRELLDVQDCDWNKALEEAGESRWPRPVFQCAAQGVLSRRFRLRVTRLGDGRFGEIQLRGWELFDAATGDNIVRPGDGYIRAPGGLNAAAMAMIDVGKGAWCHKCGSRQYTWLEWLVPNDQPPVALSHMRLSFNPALGLDFSDTQCPVDFTLECLPVDVWPQHEPDFLRDYEQPKTADDVTNLKGDQLPRWVELDSREGASLLVEGDGDVGGGWVNFRPGSCAEPAPPCTAFRLRITAVSDADAAADVELAGLRLQVVPVDDLRPICGGTCTGSGGDLSAELCGPAEAFDSNPFTRWVDASAGGIGNSATWEYQHTGEVTLEEYAITSQNGTFGVVDGLHGAPRDWVLSTLLPGGSWVELDSRADIIFSNTRETKRFKLQHPQPGSRYRLVIAAVRCGCASSSMQLGDIELLARCTTPSAPELLHGAQVLLHPSASHGDMREASWNRDDPTRLQLSLPIHPTARPQPPQRPVVGLAGGTLQWGGEPISNWYDWPMEFRMQCKETQDGEVVRYGSQSTIVCRTDRFQVEYGQDAVWALITFEEDVVVAAYGLRNSFEAQPRGEPLRWRFEVWCCGAGDGEGGAGAGVPGEERGRWEVLHEVLRVKYDTHLSCGTIYLPAPSPPARRFRLVFNEWWAPCPLAHLHSVHLLGARVEVSGFGAAVLGSAEVSEALGGGGSADAAGPDAANDSVGDVAVRFRELASVDVLLRRRQGAVRLAGYYMTGRKGNGVPVSWVLEGLTSEY